MEKGNIRKSRSIIMPNRKNQKDQAHAWGFLCPYYDIKFII